MPKKSADTRQAISLEDNFLKIIEGGDDLNKFFEGSLEQEPTKDSLKHRPAVKKEDSEADDAIKYVGKGKLKECGLELLVAKHKMVAHMVGKRAHSFTSESIVKALEVKGIVQGINFESILKIVGILEQTGTWTGKVVVAQGVVPTKSEQVSYPFLSKDNLQDPKEEWKVDGEKLSFKELVELYKKGHIPTEKEVSRVVARAVNPGEVLIVVEAKQDAVPGFDIYGTSIPVADPVLVPGKKVKRNDKTGNYEATTFGYLCIEGNVISVIPPVMVSPDMMEAFYVNIPCRGPARAPTISSVKYSLIMKGVHEKRISPFMVEKLCAGLEKNTIKKPLIKIAAGIKPVHGKDSKFILGLDLEEKAGTVQEDDTIDLKERDLIHTVEKGDLLATKYFATAGRPGFTLFKKRIKQRPGSEMEYATKGPILRKKYDDRIEYYAKIAGNVSFEKDVLTLVDVFRVEGNVDYSTGNIDVNTGLIVTESVMPGFKVVAGGNTLIGGSIDNGAHILVHGNLNVGKGIIGKDTKVIVMGSLDVDFVQDAEIVVKGDVEIRKYSFNGIVRCGGEIIMKRTATTKGGKVVGGMLCATKGISISTLGGPSNETTVLAIQRNVELLALQKRIQEEIVNYTGNIMKIMKSLGLESVDMDLIRKIIEKAPVAKREMIVKVVGNLNTLLKMRQELYQKEKAVEKKIYKELERGQVRVKREVFYGSKIQFSDRMITIDQDLGPTVFMMAQDKIIY